MNMLCSGSKQVLIKTFACHNMALRALLSILAFAISAETSVRKPHIVFVLVDDWGWANVGYHRDPPTNEVVTPNIDMLVKHGLELDQHYTYMSCSPSRSSFISGRLPVHVNDQQLGPDHYNQNDTISGYAGIPRNITGLAEKLGKAGYVTHQVGKWDAGMATPDHTPKGRGFQSSLGYFHETNDYYTKVNGQCLVTNYTVSCVDFWATDGPVGRDDRFQIYEEELFRDNVTSILSKHDVHTPLFLFYAPHIAGVPLQVPDSYVQKFSFIDNKDRQHYHAMINYLDDIIGELVSILKSKKMWHNLLFVMASDNGGPVFSGGGASNFPLRGGKGSDWQGGIRVNAFVSGGYLPKKMRGKKTDGYIHLADWYGTFCGLAGVDPNDPKAAAAKLPPVDSMDMWPLISGEVTASRRTDIHISIRTLISGDFKLLTGDVGQAGWSGPFYPNQTYINATVKCGDTGCLFNIKDDPEERNNLASAMPDKVKQMAAMLAQFNQTYFNPDRGYTWEWACDTAVQRYGRTWGPFLP